MNCKECGRALVADTKRCPCGWRAPRPLTPVPSRQAGPMPPFLEQRLHALGLNRRTGESAADQAARCRAFLKKHAHRLPASLARAVETESEREAREERLAIQEEGNG